MSRRIEFEPTNERSIRKRIVYNEDGTIYSYSYQVTLDFGRREVTDENGKTKIKQIKTMRTFEKKRDADACLTEHRHNKNRNKLPDTIKKYPLEEAFEDYIKHNESLLDPDYIHYKRNHAKDFLHFFKGAKVSDISTLDIEAYFIYLYSGNRSGGQKEHLSICTIEKHKSTLRELWRFMLKDKKKYNVHMNVVSDAVLPDKKAKFNPFIYNIEEVNATFEDMLLNEPDLYILGIFAIGLIGGLRRGEIADLRFHKIMNNEETFIVDSQIKVSPRTRQLIVKQPKGNKARITANPEVLKKIVNLIAEQRKALTGSDEINMNDYIVKPFTDIESLEDGEIINVSKYSKRWEQYQVRRNRRFRKLGKEELPIIRVHDLRHTNATLLYNAGIPPFQISCNLGHTKGEVDILDQALGSSGTTEKRYVHDTGNRKEIIDWFNKNIKIEEALYKKKLGLIREQALTLNKSGHIKGL